MPQNAGIIFKLNLSAFFVFVSLCIVSYFVLAVFSTYLNESTQWEQNLTGIDQGFVVAGDINNDNKTDLFLAGVGNGGVIISKIYTNNGISFVENITWQYNLTGVAYSSGSLGDVDNDGDLDLVLVGCASGGGLSLCTSFKAFVYINNGSSFVDNLIWGGNIKAITDGAISLGDINNDGRLDLALVGLNASSNIAEIYLNNETSFVFSKQWSQNLTGLQEAGMVFGDINNDMYIDLILAGDSGGTKMTKIYINNGSSLNSNATWNQNLLDIDKPAITLGDYDNDGDLDLTYIGCCDYHRVYKNTGNGFIQVESESDPYDRLGGIFEGSVAFGDYDNDGDLDMISTGREGATFLYVNNNTDFPDYGADPEYNLIDLRWSSLLWNDVDNDNDLDLIITGWTPNEIYIKIYQNNRSITQNNSLPSPPSSFQNYSLANGNIFLDWNNGSDNETTSLGLYYNLRVGTTSGGNQIVSGVFGGTAGGGWNGGGANGYFGNMVQRRNISLSGSRFQVGTKYYWSVQTIDTGLAKSAWGTEQTFTLTSDFTPPTITVNAPSGGLVTNQTSISFNATVYDDYTLSNVSLYGNFNSTWHNNETNASGINNTDYIFVKNLTEGSWLWGIRACDNMTNCRSSENYTIRIDTTLPSIFLMSPANSTMQTSSTTITFSYNVSDVAVNNCSLLLNNAVQRTNTSITVNISQTFTETLSNGNYNWSVRCTDAANNINSSATYSLTVSYTAPETPASSSGGGGSSGGAAAPVNKVSRIIQSISTGNNLIEFTEKEKATVGVEEILIDSATAARYVKISIEKLNNKPASIESAPMGNVYTYLQIEKTVLNDSDIKEVKIKFTLNKTWIKNNNYDAEKVLLNRFTTKWERLPTKLLSGGSQFYYYESTSPGFSVFAITAEKRSEEQKEIPLMGNVTEGTNLSEEKENAPQQETKKGKEIRYLGLVAAFIAITTILWIKLKKKTE